MRKRLKNLLHTVLTSANNSTWYCYSKITRKLGNIQGQIPGQIGGKYPPGVIFEYVLQKSAFKFVGRPLNSEAVQKCYFKSVQRG